MGITKKSKYWLFYNNFLFQHAVSSESRLIAPTIQPKISQDFLSDHFGCGKSWGFEWVFRNVAFTISGTSLGQINQIVYMSVSPRECCSRGCSVWLFWMSAFFGTSYWKSSNSFHDPARFYLSHTLRYSFGQCLCLFPSNPWTLFTQDGKQFNDIEPKVSKLQNKPAIYQFTSFFHPEPKLPKTLLLGH